MAAKKNILRDTIKSFLDDIPIEEISREVGFCQRKRKIDMVIFFTALIFSFGTGIERTITGIRSAYIAAAGERIAPSSFYNRFNRRLSLMLQKILAQVCRHAWETAPALEKKLKDFKALIIRDSTVMKVHNLLKDVFPSCRKGKGRGNTQAVLKLEATMNPMAIGPGSVKVVSERTNSNSTLEIGPWVAGSLLLFDLGYFKYLLFHQIDKHGGFFISRMKKCANPVIVGDNNPCKAWGTVFLGRKLHDILANTTQAFFDFQVLLNVSPYRNCPKSKKIPHIMRLVAIYRPDEGVYHCYLTNIGFHRLEPYYIARIYRSRWEIEMIFKELKSFFRLHEFPTRKAEIVEALIYTAILSLVMSRKVLSAFRAAYKVPPSRSPERLWTTRFAEIAFVAHVLFGVRSINDAWEKLTYFLAEGMIDPNRSRPHNLDILRA